MLNRVQAVLRAYDPCLSCSTHAENPYAIEIQLVAADGSVLEFNGKLNRLATARGGYLPSDSIVAGRSDSNRRIAAMAAGRRRSGVRQPFAQSQRTDANGDQESLRRPAD